MNQILLFAGTTEGRQIAAYLKTQSVKACVFTATEYGGELIEPSESLSVESGRMDQKAMETCFLENPGALVIDATHPYAAVVSALLREVCQKTGNPYWRVTRPSSSDDAWKSYPDVHIVSSVEEAAAFLTETNGPVLLTTGSKNLKSFSVIPDFKERVYARILSVPASIALAEEAGLKGAHLLCMQGPFSKEMNLACIHHIGAKWLVTKETGSTGGFPEKLEAAKEAGCGVLVIGRPSADEGISPESCIRRLQQMDFAENSKEEPAVSTETVSSSAQKCTAAREVALIGCGVGYDLTEQAASYCREADLLIGAKRIVEGVLNTVLKEGSEPDPDGNAGTRPDVLYEYQREKILSYLENDSIHKKAAILFSGDTGFFSGAAAFREVCEGTFRCYPGISSLSAFSAKLGLPWEHCRIISIHGRNANVISQVRKNRSCFCLLGKPDDVQTICRQLSESGMDRVKIAVGERLGEKQERITHGVPGDFSDFINDPICVMRIENPLWEKTIVPGIPDEQFIRGRVPMTKEEVRTIAVSKMRIASDSVIYDVGAGTGSISVELARLASEGTVYAAEVNPEGVSLILQNARVFGLDNLKVIEGHAPEVLETLPPPDAVLIGGSKGTAGSVIRMVFEKNPSVRVVVTAITIETVSAVLETLNDFPDTDPEIIQVTVARSRRAGSSHMMIGQNPIYLISFNGPDFCE